MPAASRACPCRPWQPVNGEDITTPDKALAIYSRVRNASTTTITLVRRGKKLTHHYEIIK